MATPVDILKKYWNLEQFWAPQEAIINEVLAKKDCVVLLPTGGGKSMCYQIPTLLFDGICIVISPLIALIEDQVSSLTAKNIKAIALTSKLSNYDLIIAFDNLQFGNYKFVYLSPEKLQSQVIQDKIKQLNVSLIAIDEAHCISEWGHDFRPYYLQLKVLKELHPNTPLIALTATATEKVLEDIQNNLSIKNATVFKKSFERPNLTYQVIFTENIYGQLLSHLSKNKNAGIVYVNSRKQTKEVCEFLNRNNLKSNFYHGGLIPSEKSKALSLWMNDEIPIMVATNAFGMGINKANVDAVVHINIPNSIENYIQESGRAGRNGERSMALILTNESLIYNAKSKFTSNLPTILVVKSVYQYINQYFKIGLGEMPDQLFDFSLQAFCETYKLNLLQTYNALKVLDRENIIALDENFSRKSTIIFMSSGSQVIDYIENNPSKKELINFVLRSYGGVFDHYTIINEHKIMKNLNYTKSHLLQLLTELKKDGIIDYNFENTSSKLKFLVPREDAYTINLISKNIEQQNNLKAFKFDAVLAYLKNEFQCRNKQLLIYFDEIVVQDCLTCDNCLRINSNNNEILNIEEKLLNFLKVGPQSSLALVQQFQCSDTVVLNTLKTLLEHNKISITSQNKYKLN
ncbi:ATP-dependent DNA helicase RecQ [Lutibacter sp.]|uniref:RecQ family ATP-dependent DNA helicase n=1 Tax=Lutibacter sp. TaxID=1925666 RepID=UPI0027339EF2|nr:RecQ family ATP-dependent DNA helicase [Lutibacter sp.]MDP3313068.1 RecQ family ATP-dependent DNA helicase [Lutibacter sp.]